MSLASQFLLLAQSLPFITNATRSSSPMRCTLLLLHWIHVCFSMLTKASFLMPTLHGRIPTFCLLKKPLTIIIPAAHQGSNGGPTASLPQLPYNNAYNRVKDFLKDLLRNILERHVANPD